MGDGSQQDSAKRPPEGCTDPEVGALFWQLVAGQEPDTCRERRRILEHVVHCPDCLELSVHLWFQKNAVKIAERLSRRREQ